MSFVMLIGSSGVLYFAFPHFCEIGQAASRGSFLTQRRRNFGLRVGRSTIWAGDTRSGRPKQPAAVISFGGTERAHANGNSWRADHPRDWHRSVNSVDKKSSARPLFFVAISLVTPKQPIALPYATRGAVILFCCKSHV